jgi:flagellar motor switch/type III secretory pathway protein FliN
MDFVACGGRGGRKVRIDLGRAWLPAGDACRLDVGAVVELDSAVEEPVGVYVDGQLSAEADAVIVGGKLGARIRSMVSRTLG